jgi:hypothetical protein
MVLEGLGGFSRQKPLQTLCQKFFARPAWISGQLILAIHGDSIKQGI